LNHMRFADNRIYKTEVRYEMFNAAGDENRSCQLQAGVKSIVESAQQLPANFPP
jgi:hypothetical protein